MATTAYIGQIEESDTLGAALHDAAKHGQHKKLKRILTKGISVDYPNSSGQSPLFSACYHNQQSAVRILLKQGANPNERSLDGATPVHAACYSCNMKMVSKVLRAGGDLRLHDNLGRTPRDWIMLQTEPKKKYKMVEFIEKTRYYAMTGNSRDSIKGSASMMERAADQTNSIIRFVRKKIRGDSSDVYVGEAKSVQSLGYGKVYLDNESWHGTISLVPLVPESCLRHDNGGPTYNNGSYMVMESMIWVHTDVTVKRLHRKPQDGGHVDLLINESEFMGKVHHPNVLLFMGICQTNNLDGLVLLYERVGCGSLFHHLHDMFEEISYENTVTILKQLCSALTFLHQQNLIHCNISSHAINMITPTHAKLGNFEYMVESCPNSLQKRSLVVNNTSRNGIYNWLAPELMEDQPPVFMSDMYELCMVIYEIFEDKIPWEDCSAELIKQKLVLEGYSVSCQSPNIPKLFQAVLDLGLQFEPVDRKLSFQQLHHLLTTLAKHPDERRTSVTDGDSTPMTAVTPQQDISSSVQTAHSCDVTPEPQADIQAREPNQEQQPDELLSHDRPPETSVVVPGDRSNNSSSDLTQSDEPHNAVTSSSCGQMDSYRPMKQRRVRIRRGGDKIRRTSFPGINSRGRVEAYRDKEDTFHYSVCLAKKTPPCAVPRHSIGCAATLPRCKKKSLCKDSPSSPRPLGPASGDMKENSGTEARLNSSSVSTSQSVSLPSMNTLQQSQIGSPSALYKAISGTNQPSRSVEIVRDIRTELAMSRERRGVEPFSCPYRTAPLTSTYGFARNDSPPKTFNYMNMGSPGTGAKVPIRAAVLEAMKRRKQLLAEKDNSSQADNTDEQNQEENETLRTNPQNVNPESPKTPTDRRWYGGMGSVKNLVKKYQEQTEVELSTCTNSEAFVCHKTSDKMNLASENLHTETHRESAIPKEEKALVVTNPSPPVKASGSAGSIGKNSIDSGDSEEVLEWVNFHLDRIKTQLLLGVDPDSGQTVGEVVESDSCDMVFNEPELSELSMTSREGEMRIEVLPDSDSGTTCNDKLDIVFSSITQTGRVTNPGAALQAGQESDVEVPRVSEEKAEPEEFYFDDEIQPSLVYAKHLKLQGTSSMPNYCSEVKPIAQRGRTASEDRHDGRQSQKSKKFRRKGSSTSPKKTQVNRQRGEQALASSVLRNGHNLEQSHTPQDSTDGHTTVLTVRSSGRLPGKHTITHTEIDRKTGIAETINEGTVKAHKVVSKVYSH